MGEVGPREAVKQERGRKGSNLQSGDSPLHRLFCGPPSSALPLLPAPHGQMLPGGPPRQPRHQTNGCQLLTAEALPGARSRCFWDPESTPDSAGHAPGTQPQPLPPRCPGSRPGWPWTLLSHTHIWSVEGPWGLCLQNISQLWSLLTATTQCPAIMSASVTAVAAPASLPLSLLILSLALRLE